MLIPPKYLLTPEISSLLQSIEACKEVINSLNTPPEIELNIRRKSTLKSSLFSARIEGNTLTLSDLPKTQTKDQRTTEVFNILKALNWVFEKKKTKITTKNILRLHQMVMTNLSPKHDLGRFRTEAGAIFNSAGIAIYIPSRPSQIKDLINELIEFCNSPREQFIPVKAALAHYIFEKIHPFLDGNGRVGRLLLQLILQKDGFGMKGILPLEAYLDNHRSEYYSVLESSERDTTEYIEFILEAIAEAASETKEQLMQKDKVDASDLLLPRRAEILNIIREQKIVNFDTIHRRFLKVNPRTLRFDIKKLLDLGLIRKRGTTKGVYYEALQTSFPT